MNEQEDRLFREGLPVLDRVAHRLGRRLGFVPLDDLLAIGRIALFHAVRTFDPARAQFEGYAALKIKWAILDGVRRETHGRAAASRARALAGSERLAEGHAAEATPGDGGRLPTMEESQERLQALLDGHAAALAVGLVTPWPDLTHVPDDAETPEEQVARGELSGKLRRAVEGLPERERALVQRHYFEGERFDLVARDLGISKSWASRLHAKAMLALGADLRRGGDHDAG